MKKIDVLDFDKTIYKKDSTIEFYKFCVKKKNKILKYLPYQLFSFGMFKLTKEKKYKERFFIFLYDFDNILKEVDEFWKINKEYIRYELLNQSNDIVVISASPKFLLEGICKNIGIKKLIATDVNKKNGSFESNNCHGKEKVNRLKKEIKNFEIENFYSDSYSDQPLAELANNAFIIKNNKIKAWNFNKKS